MGAVGYFIVAKFTPMASNGESGESAYVISGRAVESKLFFWGKFFPFKVGLNFEVKMKKKKVGNISGHSLILVRITANLSSFPLLFCFVLDLTTI